MSRFAPIQPSQLPVKDLADGNYRYGFHTPTDKYAYKSGKGLSSKVVEEISFRKDEPAWMRDFRLKALQVYDTKPLHSWGPDLSGIYWENIRYYLRPTNRSFQSWDDVPKDIKDTFDKIGVPEAERQFLAGTTAQFDSEVIYHAVQKTLQKQGVIFLSMDEGLRQYPDLVKQYLGTVIPIGDNKLAALNSACWSGGSFIYVPKNIKVGLPLQAYFRINSENAGQFERTLIIADEGSYVSYVEGCSSPRYSTASLHAAVVEIFVKKGARVQYITVQNWFHDVYNLVTKRAWVEEEGRMEWVDFNMGSKVTQKYPSFILAGKGASGETLSMAMAGAGQHQDTGSKALHLAPHTSSTIISKSISHHGGRTSYRGMVNIGPNARGAKSKVVCDALILDPHSRSDTYPTNKIFNSDVTLEHEASVSRIGEEQLFYLLSRGIKESEAGKMIVSGFADPLVKKLPLEYAVEMNRLIDLEMEGSVG